MTLACGSIRLWPARDTPLATRKATCARRPVSFAKADGTRKRKGAPRQPPLRIALIVVVDLTNEAPAHAALPPTRHANVIVAGAETPLLNIACSLCNKRPAPRDSRGSPLAAVSPMAAGRISREWRRHKSIAYSASVREDSQRPRLQSCGARKSARAVAAPQREREQIVFILF